MHIRKLSLACRKAHKNVLTELSIFFFKLLKGNFNFLMKYGTMSFCQSSWYLFPLRPSWGRHTCHLLCSPPQCLPVHPASLVITCMLLLKLPAMVHLTMMTQVITDGYIYLNSSHFHYEHFLWTWTSQHWPCYIHTSKSWEIFLLKDVSNLDSQSLFTCLMFAGCF